MRKLVLYIFWQSLLMDIGGAEMFVRMTNFSGNLFDDFRRLEEEMDELLGRWPWPAGIRSVVPGSCPPINVGTTTEEADVYGPCLISPHLKVGLSTIAAVANLGDAD
jgi:hypothetical protein